MKDKEVNMIFEGFDFFVSNHGDMLWRAGVGEALGYVDEEEYLRSIPAVPAFPRSWAERFPRLILVDARLVEKLGLLESAKLLGIRRFHDVVDLSHDPEAQKEAPLVNDDLAALNPCIELRGVYWIRAQDGTLRHHEQYESVEVTEMRGRFAPDEVGLTVTEGLFLYVQEGGVPRCYHPEIGLYSSFDLLLPGTVDNRVSGTNNTALISGYVEGDVLDFRSGILCGDDDHDSCWGYATRGRVLGN